MFNNFFKPQTIKYEFDKNTGKGVEVKPPPQAQGPSLGTKIMNFIGNFNKPKPLIDPTATSITPTPQAPQLAQKVVNAPLPTPTYTPTAQFNSADIKRRLEAGYSQYFKNEPAGGVGFIGEYLPSMIKAAETYPLFKANPYLIPALSILETSGGRNITRPNNLINWGVRIPENNKIFSQMEPSKVLELAMKKIGQDSPYYKKFRHGNKLTEKEIMEFARIFEPMNEAYGKNMLNTISMFEAQQ